MAAHLMYKISPTEIARKVFKYCALSAEQPSIRILTLFPDVGGNPVNCSFTAYIWDPETGLIRQDTASNSEEALSSPQQGREAIPLILPQDPRESITYEALSYTWGDIDQLYRITINDQIFPVTRDLLEAFFFLRNGSSSRTLWIDAVCINQVNTVEKGRQIQQMHRIYEHASRVVIWLGIAYRNSDLAFDLAFDFVDKLYSCFPPEARRGSEGELRNERGYELEYYVLSASIEHLVHAHNAREWLALQNLFKRPYWSRAWIFQELLMARETIVVCGSKYAKWGPIEIAMKIVWSTGNETRDLINSSRPIKDQETLFPVDDQNPHTWPWYYNHWLLGVHEGRLFVKRSSRAASSSQTMERWLELINIRLCKYQHDKIYCILGIAPKAFAKLIPDPDYTQPVQNVYKQAVRAFVLGTESLNILCYSHYSDTQDSLPSWTFDWRRERRLHRFHDVAWGIGIESQRAWHSSALKSHVPQFAEDLSILSVHGIALGVIRYLKLEHELLRGLQKKPDIEPDLYGHPKSHHDRSFTER